MVDEPGQNGQQHDGPEGDAGEPALTPKQEAALSALLTQPTVEKAAAAAGVGERTLYRWLKDPLFSAAYREARRQQFGHAVSLAVRYTAASVNGLARIAQDTSAPHSARVSANVALLKFSREAIELDELAARVEALEAAEKQRSAEEKSSWRR